jgi:hypothetical protein
MLENIDDAGMTVWHIKFKLYCCVCY